MMFLPDTTYKRMQSGILLMLPGFLATYEMWNRMLLNVRALSIFMSASGGDFRDRGAWGRNHL